METGPKNDHAETPVATGKMEIPDRMDDKKKVLNWRNRMKKTDEGPVSVGRYSGEFGEF